MKLWEKGIETAEIVEKFTVGNDRLLDLAIAKYDVMGSIAHAQMLNSVGVLEKNELEKLIPELEALLFMIEKGDFEIEEGFEDVHSKVEHVLTEKLGDVGKKIHTARSRNDQVLVDMHLYLKAEIADIKQLIKNLFDRLISLSNKYQKALMPGYTHLQIAMPSSFGLWFAAYAEALIDDLHFLNAAYKVADQNPLGSGAGYGSSLPIDRDITTDLLGFAVLKYNVVAAQMSRGKVEKATAMGMASAAGTLAKLAMDVCLYMSQNFGFLSFPDELTTGSSIMPHKKNPDVFELIRAKCNKIQALPQELILLTNNLPSGYHRDFQLLKESLMPAINELKSCLEIADFMFSQVQINPNILNDEKYQYLYTVETVNQLVQQGMPFREAYRQVGEAVQNGTYQFEGEVTHTHQGSLGQLNNEEITEKFLNAFQG